MSEEPTQGTLKAGEPHPSAHAALRYVNSLDPMTLVSCQGAFASCSLSGNRSAEICSETLHRVMCGKAVSDRYVLGLAWAIRDMEDLAKKDTPRPAICDPEHYPEDATS